MKPQNQKWESVCAVDGLDEITLTHIGNLLRSHRIESGFGGSVLYDIDVPAARKAEALRLLSEDAPRSGYRIYLGPKQTLGRAPKSVPVLYRIGIAAALRQARFGRRSALGRFLRSKEIAVLTAQYPFVASFDVAERHYLKTPKEFAVAYDAELTLRKSLREHGGFWGRYQVFDEGRRLKSLGSTGTD